MKEPKELLLDMLKADEIEWLNDRKIEVADVARAMKCNQKTLYEFAQRGNCPFISASIKEEGVYAGYLVWPGKAEEYIGRERLKRAMEERETTRKEREHEQ